MIQITSFPPPDQLAPYIHLVWKAETTHSFDGPSVTVPPSGCVLLTLFISKDRYLVRLRDEQFKRIPRAALQAQHYGPIENKGEGLETLAFGIMLKPATLHRFWGINMSELTHRISDAEELLGDEITLLINQLEQNKSDIEKAELIFAFLTRQTNQSSKKKIITEEVINYMQQKHGTDAVSEIAKQFECSTRSLERKFQREIGVSPKYLNRIIQFNHMISIMKYSPGIKWAELAQKSGYYDQAHLINAFIEFSGQSPVKFGNEDHSITQTHLVKHSDRKPITHQRTITKSA